MPSTQVAPPTTDTPETNIREHKPAAVDLPGKQDDGASRSEWQVERDSAPASPTEPQGFDLPIFAVKVMLGFGRALMTIGVLLLLFAAFQLWGTGLSEAKAQAELADRFEEQLAANLEDAATVGPIDGTAADFADGASDASGQKPAPLVVELPENEDTSTATTITAEQQPERLVAEQVAPVAPVTSGDPVGVLNIPAIGVTKTIAEGTTRDVLRSGPGHYPSTPLPGQPGNVSIAGHRTTHGAPFLDIDQLSPGDEITIETVTGTYTYAVEAQLDESGNDIGHLIVKPEDVGVIMNKGDDRLTLTACHPKYSARQRIVVTAVLVAGPPPPAVPDTVIQMDSTAPDAPLSNPTQSDDPPGDIGSIDDGQTRGLGQLDGPDRTVTEGLAFGADPVDSLDSVAFGGGESLGWQARYALPTLLWATFTGFVALGGWFFGRIWRRFPAYLMAVPPLTLCLYYCFVNLERFIPAV